MDTLWIVTANAARARICERQADGRLADVADLVHPHSRLAGRDLADDRAGRVERDLGGDRHAKTAYEPPTDARQKEHERFAREVARQLDDAVAQGRCQGLVIYAAPAFLGELRAALGPVAAKALRHDEAADLTATPLDELRRRVDAVLRPGA